MKKDKEWLKEEINKEIENIDYPLRYSTDEYNTRMSMIEVFKRKVDQLDEPELPIIPQFFAEWIEESKGRHHSLYQAMKDYCSPTMNQWIQGFFHSDTFARAWLDGYTIEKEPKWIVKVGEKYLHGWLNTTSFTPFLIGDIGDKWIFSKLEKVKLVADLVDGEVVEVTDNV